MDNPDDTKNTQINMKRSDYIEYMNTHVSGLPYQDKLEILQAIVNSPKIDERKIMTKGTGTLIKYHSIPTDVLIFLYELVKKKITQKNKQLEELPDNSDDDNDDEL